MSCVPSEALAKRCHRMLANSCHSPLDRPLPPLPPWQCAQCLPGGLPWDREGERGGAAGPSSYRQRQVKCALPRVPAGVTAVGVRPKAASASRRKADTEAAYFPFLFLFL